MTCIVVNPVFFFRKMLDGVFESCGFQRPALFLDVDDRRICRIGLLVTLTLHINALGQSHTYIVHIHVLEDRVFSIPTINGPYTLRTIPKNVVISKIFFDVRRDADALYAHYGIAFVDIIDLQLMELSARAKRDGWGSDWPSAKLIGVLGRWFRSGLRPSVMFEMRPGPAVEDWGTQRLGEATDVIECQPLSPGDQK